MEFNELNLAELDKDLTPEERDEWQAIYASYRSHSVMRGEAAGVDYHEFEFIPEGKKKSVKEKLRCVIVILYRIKIIIPEPEMFLISVPDGGYVLQRRNRCPASGAPRKYRRKAAAPEPQA